MVNSAFFKTTVSLLLVISSFCLHSTTEDNNGWIPINGEYGSLVLNVKINGHPAKVLLDTGASIHTLSSKIVSEANIKSNNARELKLIGLNGEVRAPLSGSFDITADGQTFTLRDIPIVKQNSSFDMILGRDFFEQSVV
ncbi:MAG: hypothetical protein CMP47_02170 [Rickettsiales bacterium]|nr:hypothetical protein [Rickettsiales bacterium]